VPTRERKVLAKPSEVDRLLLKTMAIAEGAVIFC
jgi:hypothetical protein